MTVRSARSVVAHVAPEDLHAVDRDASVRYARMIDGRTVYQHLLFVEPRLRAANPNLCTELLTSGTPDAGPVRGLACPVRRDAVSAFEPFMSNTRAILARQGTALDSAEPLRSDPRLTETGLVLLAQLALPDALAAAANAPVTRADAMRTLGVAALQLLWLWARAETRSGADLEAPLPPSAREFLESFADVFVASVLIEFLVRSPAPALAENARADLADALGGGAALEDLIGEGDWFPLSRELVAYWLPLWNRSAVIFSSPFDLMSELETFAD